MHLSLGELIHLLSGFRDHGLPVFIEMRGLGDLVENPAKVVQVMREGCEILRLRHEGCRICIVFGPREKDSSHPIEQEHLDHWFKYHAPDEGDSAAYEAIRAAGKAFAEVVLANTPSSADRTAAVRKIREAVYSANAARACKGL